MLVKDRRCQEKAEGVEDAGLNDILVPLQGEFHAEIFMSYSSRNCVPCCCYFFVFNINRLPLLGC